MIATGIKIVIKALKEKIIDVINNNEHRVPCLRILLRKVIELAETPWFFLNKPTRCYIREGVSVEEFFKKLKKRNVEYVVLRWFENLPEIQDGEDIDLLIRDSHLIRVYDLISYKKNSQPVDIYTDSVKYQKSFQGKPYYLPFFSNVILQ